MGKSLLDRAKEVMNGAGVLTALALAPLGMASVARADSIQFADLRSTVDGSTGGVFGRAGGALFDSSVNGITGAVLTGNTNVSGLVNGSYIPYGDPAGYVMATHLAENNGIFSFGWSGALTGTTQSGDIFHSAHDFSVGFITEGSHPVAPLSWFLTTTVTLYSGDTISKTIASQGDGLGISRGTDDLALIAGDDAVSWNVTLSFNWQLTTSNFEITNSDGNDRLQIDIPGLAASGGVMEVYVDQTLSSATAATPLPPTVWMVGSLLGIVGIGRMRKTASPMLSH
jgi:hypothetical protein